MNSSNSSNSTSLISIKGAGKSYGNHQALRNVDWHVGEGDWWGVVGPNGSGKSTLIQLIAGTEQLSEGQIHIDGRDIGSYSRKDLSRMIAVLQQDGLPAISYPVRDVVEMGRYPYQNWLGREKGDGALVVDRVLEDLGLTELADRPLDALSGGQRQRVALAKVMAQEPRLLLLDEPTTFLDIKYQLQFMELLSAWRQRTNITIVAVLHDLNLAALFCDHILALREGLTVGKGTPHTLINDENIQDIFRVKPAIVSHPDHAIPQLLLRRDID
ncbi:ABC transporter ATP-binding protein [Paenibacillus sp. FSL H8-0317]|uniref:ABC transporter ATP-binding protein n=1 Tax=Paenibacillus TaxID=44249 RepID=UPI001C8EBCA8|nr:ABC transporter ATP-binding protein [Paenibacillus xylanexedens]MBY0115198.1 ABC transporter ATP-binding protein [Paenibacillus xylanexedens]MCF7755941.1 ABC transporter ATP-binding protein [Paenibacillus xylanexedens]